MDRVRIGLIGAGVMGRIHARCLSQEVTSGQLVAVADLDREKAAQCAEEFGAAAAYTDHTALLANSSIDAVVVCTPGRTHAAIIEAAANAGKNVFCEKPIDWDLTAVHRALVAVQRCGIKLQIGFQRRFDPAFQDVKQAIEQGAVGRLHTAHLISRDPASPYAGPKADGDLYFDSTIHDLDVVRFLTGDEVTSVYSVGAPTAVEEGEQGENPDKALTVLRLAGGATAVIDNSRRSSVYDQRVEVFGPNGIVRVENQTAAPGRSGELPFFAHRYFDAYVAELTSFVDSVRTDSEPAVTGADGRAALVLAIAAYRSYRERRPVNVSEMD
jgi:myo-inositol 2-dehydrogenase/D-chiro-inositol 1-dehydrogenase